MATHNDQIVKHLISATEHLLRQKPKAQFINDSPSVIVSGGESLSAEALAALSYTCVQSQVDVIYVEFEPGLPELGPENVIVMGERDGALYPWSDCALWSPPSGEPLLIMPRAFFSVVAPVCLVLGVPIEILGLLLAVESIPDICRTLGNVTADVAVAGASDDPASNQT